MGSFEVNGTDYVADLRRIADLDLYSLLLDNQSYEVHVQDTERNNYRVMVSAQGYEGYEVRVLDERAYRVAKSTGGLVGASAEGAIKAPIPGLVVRVLVAEGDVVEKGQSVVILQAMKMENELRAPRGHGGYDQVQCRRFGQSR